VNYYIPHRQKEGYGLHADAVKKIARNGSALLITVDCGVSDRQSVALARNSGMDVVVTDHHQIPSHSLPDCPVINPHQPGCRFPFKDLSGVGLAFFLAIALRSALREMGWFEDVHEPDLKEYLDLVALGTIADRSPMLDQNRILVNHGMETMSRSRWEGIRAIKEVASVTTSALKGDDLAFKMAPRLNAPGRLGDASIGIEILTTKGSRTARNMALELNSANIKRQTIERKILAKIEDMLPESEDIGNRRTIVLAGENWHAGVLGIVANRIMERFHRPCLVMNVKDGVAVGSGRSIEGFPLYDALKRLDHLFEKFGGHSQAAGFTISASRIDILSKKLETFAQETLETEDLIPSITADAELGLAQLSKDLVSQIEMFEPFGSFNPAPIFLARALQVLGIRIVGEHHLKLRIGYKGKRYDAIGFGLADRCPSKGDMINMLYIPEMNAWQGYEKLQLRIIDLETWPGRELTRP
jgi:single-stranded-DNA-specific exonuclease